MRSGTTVQLQASIPAEIMQGLKVIAEKEGRSVSNLVGRILKQEIENHKREEENAKD